MYRFTYDITVTDGFGNPHTIAQVDGHAVIDTRRINDPDSWVIKEIHLERLSRSVKRTVCLPPKAPLHQEIRDWLEANHTDEIYDHVRDAVLADIDDLPNRARRGSILEVA
jgi:hypothetical protein